MDAASSVLVVYYSCGDGPGQLHTYTVMMEQRGDSTFKVRPDRTAGRPLTWFGFELGYHRGANEVVATPAGSHRDRGPGREWYQDAL